MAYVAQFNAIQSLLRVLSFVVVCVFDCVPADCREILLPLMTDQLKFHLEKREEPKACCQLLSDILEVLYRKDVVRNTVFLLYALLFLSGANRPYNKGIQNSLHKKAAHFTVVILQNSY